jgi:hypothetical protein
VALTNPKIVKRKDISNGENLSEAPEDEGFNLPLSALHWEQSAILAEKCTPVNLGMDDKPQVTYYVESLQEGEPKILGAFLKHRKKNFAWAYSDMLGLDPEVVVHHLAV